MGLSNKVNPAAVYRDILVLQQEFDGFEIDFENHELAVTTDPIVLENTDLGRFQVRLDWSQIGTSKQPYRVVALDPHPAARNKEVTHPHVQDECLCEGEGRAAIASALSGCRLYDFFTLVSQVLHTYGRGNAYVELPVWDGALCDDCRDIVDEEDRYSCQQCGNTLCPSCAVPCQHCQESYCSACLRQCAACREVHCSACLGTCSACRKRFCEDCLEEGLCRSCSEKTHEEDQDDDPADDFPCEEPCPAGQAQAAPQMRPFKPLLQSLRLSPTAWAKLLYLRDAGDSEVGGFGISAAEDLLYIEDVELVRQTCDIASVAFDDQAVADYFDRQVDAGRKVYQLGRIWVHTHPGSSSQPSATDDETFARVFGKTDWAVMFILARGGQTYARLEFHIGPGGSLVLPVEVDYSRPFPASDHAAWSEAYLTNVQIEEWPRVLDAGSNLESGLRAQPANLSDFWDELLDEKLIDSCQEGIDLEGSIR